MNRAGAAIVTSVALGAGLLAGTVVEAPPAAAATVGAFPCEATVSPTSGVTSSQVGSDCVITFTYSGSGSSTSYSWTRPSFVTSIQYLVVGGGGGGGADDSINTRGGSGGGGGGVGAGSASVTASSLNIYVGSGGASATTANTGYGSSGQSSSISTSVAIASAAGGGAGGPGGQSGGTSGNGFVGGFGSTSGGGGGGSAGVGVNGTSSGTAVGGSGTSSSINGTSQTYGQGGPGGALTGGGNGQAGTDGFGTGGGGGSPYAGGSRLGGKGGSGIVIIRYSTKASALTTEPPASAVIDETLTQSPVVTLTEAGVAASGTSVSVALGTKPTPSGNQISPVLDGTTTVATDGSGVATFSDLSIRGPTGNYTLTFTASGYTTLTSITIAVTVGDPSALSLISASPTSVQVANPGNTSTVTVQALDAGGNTITTGGATVALSASAGSIGTVTDVGNGTYTATYTGTSSIADSPVTVSGTINAIVITDTAAITLTPGAPSALSITTQPAAGASASGTALANQPVVQVVDAFGNLVTSATGTVTATITSGSGSLTSNTASISSGVATFSGLTITGAASESYVLTFSSGALASAASNAFSLARAAQTISFGAAPTPTWSSAGTFSVSATASPSGLAVAYSIDASSSSVCSIANSAVGTVTMLTAGSCVVNANQAGNADYAAATQVQQTVTIARASQTVSFTYTGGTKTFGDADFSVASMASASSGLSPTFTSSTTPVCTVTSAGTVTLVAQGTCTLVADQPGDDRYLAATSTVSQSFTVNRGTTTITWAPTTALTVPQSGSTFAAATSLAGAVTYAVTAQGTTGCTVNSGARTISFTGTGSCVVSATAAPNDQYDSVSTSQTFVISKADQSVTINDPGAQTYSSGGTFSVSGTATSSLTVSFGTTTPGVCTVSGTTVTIVAAGTCTITGDQAGDGSYNAAPQATRDVTIGQAATTVTWSPTTGVTTVQSPLTPSSLATASTGGGAITYAVTDAGTTGCTVDASTAELTYTTSGSCQVTATAAATDNYASSSTTVTFVITKVAQNITFGPLSTQAYGTGPYVISGSTDATALILSYSTTTPAVCSVSGASSLIGGVTTAAVSLLATGTCTISAGQAGSNTYSAATSVTQSFAITQGTQASLSFSNPSTVVFDGALTLQTIGGSGAGSVTYAVTTAGTASCSVGLTSGVLSFTSAGTCVVQATKAGGGVFADVSTSLTTITVSRAPQSTTITSAVPSNPLPGDTYAVTSTASSGLTTNLSILAGLGTVCSISGSGASETVTFLATGTCVIYASQLGNGNYLPSDPEDSQTIEVGALNQSITFGSLVDKDFGMAPFVVAATASSGLTVSFSSTTSSVCTATAAGVVTILTVGECRISASQVGNAQYAAASTVVRAFDVVAVVPFAPTLTSISAGDGSITIAYAAPSFTGGAAITGYQAVATPASGPAVTGPCADLSAPLACTITGLTNGTAYTVTVAAINSVGVGAASLASAARTPAAAAMAVTDAYATPSDESVDLYFSAISTGGLGGGAFTRYEIYRRVAGDSWPGTPTTTITSQGSGELTQSFSGLSNGTSYEFKIVVITTANLVEIAGNTTIVTEFPSTTPSAPVDLLVVPRSGTSATVYWSVPLSDGGAPITSYLVTATGGATCGTVTIDPATQVATCNLTGLAYSTSYRVTVGAVNRMGRGTTTTATYATSADPNAGGGGSGGGGGGRGEGEENDDPSSGGDSGGPSGPGKSDGPRPPFPPNIPTPDGPSDEEIEEVLKKPSTGSTSELPTLPIIKGTGPMPGGNPNLDSGLRSGIEGVKVLPTASAELVAALAAGAKVSMASDTAQVGYMTSRKITIAPGTMLQVVTSLDPDDQELAFRLWMQDRTGAWFRMGRTTSVDGKVVFPVMQFDTPGTYQVIATSVSGSRAVDADGNPVFGSTTVRTIVIVTPRQALGTKLCPNMIAFDQRSAILSKESKRQIRKLAECLGAMPAIKVSGYVGQAKRPAAAKKMAFLRARNVRNYLRELGYDGGAKIRTSIELRPASCESTNNRCALVRLELGTERASERAAWDLVTDPQVDGDGGATDGGEAGTAPPVEGAVEQVISARTASGGHDPTQLHSHEST